MKKYAFFALFLLIAQDACAQFDDPRVDLNWFTIETPHFNVVYQEGAHRTAELVAKIAEQMYVPITTLYQHVPDQKVTFIIKDFSDYSNGETNYYTNTIVIWANALDFDLRGTHDWLRNVVSHEFTHDVQIQTAMKFGRRVPVIALQYFGYENERRQDVFGGFPNTLLTMPVAGAVVPAWFAEGTAQFQRPETGYETWDAQRDMVLRMYALDSNLLTWTQMSTFGKTSLGDESSYNQGYSLIRYIAQRYGMGALRGISYNLASLGRMTIDGAIEKTLGISGQDLYDEWKSFLVRDYARRTADVKRRLVIGDTTGKTGFANFYPQFSRDGKKILYISNKTSDYFLGLAFLHDVATGKDTMLVAPVSGRPAFSPDDSLVVYAKRNALDTHESSVLDVYAFDRKTKRSRRVTTELRAHSPCVSPDGRMIAFITNADGTQNLRLTGIRGGGRRQITAFANGEQVYDPIFTADGAALVFGYSITDNRSIASIDTNGTNFRILLSGNCDYRNPAFQPGGARLYFSCDSNGIYNIYSADWNEKTHAVDRKTMKQITNVPGGAFYPAVDSTGDVAYSLYTSAGFKLALLKHHADDSLTAGANIAAFRYMYPDTAFTELGADAPAPEQDARSSADSAFGKPIDWTALRNYNDRQVPDVSSAPYKSIFTTLFTIPLLRIDTYNKLDRGLQNVKLGALFTSSDVTDRLGVVAGGMTNSRFEYDAFAALTFHDRIPLLWQTGLTPQLTFAIYNSQIKTNGAIPIPENTQHYPYIDTVQLPVGVTYNFLSFDLAAQNHIFNAGHTLYFDFNHTQYNAAVATFANPRDTTQLVTLPTDLYLFTNTFTATYEYKGIAPSSTEEINPVGREVFGLLAQNWARVEDTTIISSDNGLPEKLYQPYDYATASLNWREHLALPFWTHTLSLEFHADYLFGGGADAFTVRSHALFDSYIGGLTGMQGYPYYALGGTRTAFLKAIYRFPVSDNLDFRVLPLYFDKLYIGVFGDLGNAWDGAFTHGTWSTMKIDAGAELRIDAFLWYNVPTKIFFNAAYGVNQFTNTFYIANDQTPQTVTYGKQWLFYGGIGFDFPD